MRTWFTSDTHFHHKNILHLGQGRPYHSLEEMHNDLIKKWNKEIKHEDRVYVLGDFCFAGSHETSSIMHCLPGHKILIQGNHDSGSYRRFEQLGFELVLQQAQIIIGGQRVNLSHFPYAATEEETAKYRVRYAERRLPDDGNWLLHGHVHTSWKFRKKMINIGVDMWNFKPVSMNEIESLIARNPDGFGEIKLDQMPRDDL